MYIHIGEDIMVLASDIIAIINKKSVEESNEFRLFLKARKNDLLQLKSEGLHSYIITNQHIYLSPLASNTLLKRLTNIDI